MYRNKPIQRNDSVLGESLTCVLDRNADGCIHDHVLGLDSRISPRSFVQANGYMTEVLYQTLIDCLQWQGNGSLIDLYCGTGLLTMILAKQGGEVIGVDNNQSAIDDAIENANRNELDITFNCQTAESFLASHDCSTSTLVLDPPRQGIHQSALDAILSAQPKSIGMISCNIDTLGRDLRVLIDGGYQLDFLQSVEMFCHTPHLEIVVGLRLR